MVLWTDKLAIWSVGISWEKWYKNCLWGLSISAIFGFTFPDSPNDWSSCSRYVQSSIIYARILKAHSHSMSGSSTWASLECHCCFWIAGGLVSYLCMWLPTTHRPAIKNSIDTQEKLRLNLHSLSVSELLEYRRKSVWLSIERAKFPSCPTSSCLTPVF
jgi:hypothetical protein